MLPTHSTTNQRPVKTQAGIALVSVLISVAIISTIASSLMYNFQADVNRVANFVHQGRALMYALAAEEAARSMLAYDLINSSGEVDSLADNWVLPIEPTELQSGGSISVTIIDLAGLININNFFLVGDEQVLTENNISLVLSDLYFDQVGRVFESSGITDTDVIEGMRLALQDWMDSDSQISRSPTSRAEGGEDGYYRLGGAPWPSYQAANALIADCSELQIIRHFREADNSAALNSFINLCVALPEVLPVNVNTADSQVLRALAENMGDVGMDALLAERFINPFQSKNDFYAYLSNNSGTGEETWRERLPATMIDVKSNYFLSMADIAVGVSQVKAYAVIQRLGVDDLRIIGRKFEFR